MHGTEKAAVDSIIKQGLDHRMASPDNLYGKGIYLTESSTKADQYSGNS
jgi:hypothetical protein